MKVNWKQKLSSRKFWSAGIGVVISIIAFTNATPETTERVVALISSISVLCMYMLSEGIADSGREI